MVEGLFLGEKWGWRWLERMALGQRVGKSKIF
jgi:hypothetical protein